MLGKNSLSIRNVSMVILRMLKEKFGMKVSGNTKYTLHKESGSKLLIYVTTLLTAQRVRRKHKRGSVPWHVEIAQYFFWGSLA